MEKEDYDISKDYEALKKEYDLPSLDDLTKDFEIDKDYEKKPKSLLRDIRKSMNEKISSYLHLMETLISPSSPPMFVFSVLRGLDSTDKENLREIYKKLSKLEIRVMRLDTLYDESQEAKFIKDSYFIWQEIKPLLIKIIDKFEESLDKESYSKKGGYFG